MQTRWFFVAAAALVSCSSVKMVQRDGCWIRQTEKWPSGVDEQLGFCARPAPVWAQDRAARLVQECMAQADYRWENRALAAWSHNQPIPQQEPDGKIAETCMSEVTATLGLEAENARLKARLEELAQDRRSLQAREEKDRAFLEQSHEDVVSALGEAAKKVPPAAIATATSTGTAKTESDLRAPPASTLVELNTQAPPAVSAPPAPASSAAPVKSAAPLLCPRKLSGGGKLTDSPLCAPPAVAGSPRTE